MDLRAERLGQTDRVLERLVGMGREVDRDKESLEAIHGVSTGRTKGPGGRFNLLGSDFWYWNDGLELRGEYVRLSRKSDDRLDKWGYYLQAAYRMSYYLTKPMGWSGVVGRFEPVIRWGQTKGFNPDNRDQLALGLNYWLYPSVPLKFTYEFNQGKVKNDRLFLQLAYGF